MLVSSALLLFYTCLLVPVQICIWNYDDPCIKFPTLYFDVVVDCFFLVGKIVVFLCKLLLWACCRLVGHLLRS